MPLIRSSPPPLGHVLAAARAAGPDTKLFIIPFAVVGGIIFLTIIGTLAMTCWWRHKAGKLAEAQTAYMQAAVAGTAAGGRGGVQMAGPVLGFGYPFTGCRMQPLYGGPFPPVGGPAGYPMGMHLPHMGAHVRHHHNKLFQHKGGNHGSHPHHVHHHSPAAAHGMDRMPPEVAMAAGSGAMGLAGAGAFEAGSGGGWDGCANSYNNDAFGGGGCGGGGDMGGFSSSGFGGSSTSAFDNSSRSAPTGGCSSGMGDTSSGI